LAAGALDSGFCARWREAKTLAHLVLGEALPFGEEQCLSIRRFELLDELANAWREVRQIRLGF